jgi:SAM-dependent methyltransferase
MALLNKINYYLKQFGFNSGNFFLSIKGIPYFLKNYSSIKSQLKKSNNEFKMGNIYPCLDDRFYKAGTIPLHYFYQDLIVAQKIFIKNPNKHVDIGSRIDGFVAHIASFRKIEVFDIRKLDFFIPNVKFVQADLMSNEFNLENYCDSISSLNAIEHFGLGRYGDKIDINGHLKGINNIYKLLVQGGKFYFSVPIGPQRIEFDAHRVFSVKYLLDLFVKKYKIDSFSYVNDNNRLFVDVDLNSEEAGKNFNCNFGCGIFELTKL